MFVFQNAFCNSFYSLTNLRLYLSIYVSILLFCFDEKLCLYLTNRVTNYLSIVVTIYYTQTILHVSHHETVLLKVQVKYDCAGKRIVQITLANLISVENRVKRM